MTADETRNHLLSLYLMAMSDLELTTAEVDTILAVAKAKGLEKADFEQIVLSPSSLEALMPESIIERIACLFDFVRVAQADKKLDSAEKQFFVSVSKRFELTDQEAEELLDWLTTLVDKDLDYDQLRLEIENLINN